MRRLMLGAALCLLTPLSGCADGASKDPPAEIAEACVSTALGNGVLYAPEWVKPIVGATSAISWEPVADRKVIFRSDTTNPLNGGVKQVSVLFAPTTSPVKTEAYCKGYYEPILVDVDGMEESPDALKRQLWYPHEMGLSHYNGRVPQGVPLTLEYAQ